MLPSSEPQKKQRVESVSVSTCRRWVTVIACSQDCAKNRISMKLKPYEFVIRGKARRVETSYNGKILWIILLVFPHLHWRRVCQGKCGMLCDPINLAVQRVQPLSRLRVRGRATHPRRWVDSGFVSCRNWRPIWSAAVCLSLLRRAVRAQVSRQRLRPRPFQSFFPAASTPWRPALSPALTGRAAMSLDLQLWPGRSGESRSGS